MRSFFNRSSRQLLISVGVGTIATFLVVLLLPLHPWHKHCVFTNYHLCPHRDRPNSQDDYFLTVMEYSAVGWSRRECWRKPSPSDRSIPMYVSRMLLQQQWIFTARDVPPGEPPLIWGRINADRKFLDALRWGVDDAKGWPFKCLWCQVDVDDVNLLLVDAGTFRLSGGVELRSIQGKNILHSAVLPLRPLWLCLIANIFIFGSSWLLMTSAVRSLRRRWRYNKHQCVACGYDLGSTNQFTICPECGSVRRVTLRTSR